MLGVSVYQAPLGPNGLRKYECELKAVERTGLDDLERDLVVSSLSSFARGAARLALEAQAAARRTNAEWWAANARVLDGMVNAGQFSLASRIGAATGKVYEGTTDPTVSFESGLRRFIEGIRFLVNGKLP